MRKLFPFHLSLFTLLSSVALSQPSTSFSDCDNLQSVVFTNGDILTIGCDTAYVLNKLTFRRYDSAYKDLRRKSSNIANLMSTYDEIIALQENRIKEQTRSYNELRASFSSLTSETQMQITESAGQLGQALTSMEALNRDLGETKILLREAKEIIEAEKQGLNLEKLLWGVGGFSVGILAGIVLAN